jgi:hypothetical protein
MNLSDLLCLLFEHSHIEEEALYYCFVTELRFIDLLLFLEELFIIV